MSLTCRRVINQFLAWADACLAPNTVAAYRHQLGKVPPSVKRKDCRHLRPADLTRWAKTWHEGQAVVRAFNWAVFEAKLIKANPFADVRLPGRGERQRILSPQEIARILRAARRPGRRFLLALRETMARPQEIRLAAWDDLQTERPGVPLLDALRAGQALLVLRDYKDRKRRKDATAPRVILITPRLGRLLARIMPASPTPGQRIFVNAEAQPWTRNAVRCLMRRLRSRLGFERDKHGETICAYTFRHSTATNAAANGITDRLLADLLGHVETRTTRRYQHLCVGHLRAALDRLRRDREKGHPAPPRRELPPSPEALGDAADPDHAG